MKEKRKIYSILPTDYIDLENNPNDIIVDNSQPIPLAITECIAPAGPRGADGGEGETGPNAYEIAVANGFVGTETEWLNSLIGPTGPPAVTKSIIPYYYRRFYGSSYTVNGQLQYTITALGFGEDIIEVKADQLGDPVSFTISSPGDHSAAAFSSAYDFKITSIAFSALGGGEIPDFPTAIALGVFLSDQGSNVFTIVPNSLLLLSPNISTTTMAFNVDGMKDIDIFVPAGTKVSIGAYLQALQDDVDGGDVTSLLSGSISIEAV